MMFLAALQIAGPMVAVLLLADVALALLSKAAPSLNIFAFGFPVKILLTLTLLGLTFPLLPPALDALMHTGLEAITSFRSG
jgi:flagellar biosynthesis protein FliR